MTDAAVFTPSSPAGLSGRFKWAGIWLGFALGGFFDGILLHQVLQWHHLLSALEGPAFRDIRVQILADGLFHVLMYVIAAVGLWLLWRTRLELAGSGADRVLLANALIGFGLWHVVDGIVSHWLLGIHRIRMDVSNPLLWDILWFAVFGVGLIVLGLFVGSRGGGASTRRGRAATPAALVFAVLVTGPVAALPPADSSTVLVLFRPGSTSETVFRAVAAVDGRTVWSDPSGELWAIDLSSGGNAMTLYSHGALLVSNGLLPVGCFNWSRI